VLEPVREVEEEELPELEQIGAPPEPSYTSEAA
jgi:hypothetical protein